MLVSPMLMAAVSIQAIDVKGVIIDKNTNEPLIGATIQVEGTTTGVVTDIDGKFEIKNVAENNVLVIQYVAYETRRITVSKNTTGEITIAMTTDNQQLDEVMVVARKNNETAMALLKERQNSSIAIENIGARDLSVKGISNVQEGVKKITGISVASAGQIIVRGLGDRYSITTLNGMPIASPNPDHKLIPLNLFPSSTVKNITVSKVYDAAAFADYSGAHIDIATKDHSGEDFFNVSVSTGGYINTLGRNFYEMDRSGTLFTTPRVADNVMSLKSSDFRQYSKENEVFESTFNVERRKALPAIGGNASWGKNFDLGNRHTLSALASLSLSNDLSSMQNAFVRTLEASEGRIRSDFEYDSYTNKLQIAGLGSLIWSFRGQDHIGYTMFYARNAENEYMTRTGYDEEGHSLIGINDIMHIYTLQNHQLDGLHNINDAWSINWKASYSNTSSEEPDRRQVMYERGEDSSLKLFTLNQQETMRYYGSLGEQELIGSLSSEYKYGKKNKLDFGATYKRKKRDYAGTRFYYDVRELNKGIQNIEDIYTPGKYINQSAIQNGLVILSKQQQPRDSYNSGSDILAGFASTEIYPIESLMLNVGLRYEMSRQYVEYHNDQSLAEVRELNNHDLFPAFNARYQMDDKNNFRLSFSRTVTRPSFIEMAPFLYSESYGSAQIRGNKDLQNGYNYNIDLRYELINQGGDLISATAYYKFLQDPIERTQVIAGGATMHSFNNADNGMATGIEVEIRKSIIRGLVSGANASYMYTNVILPEGGAYTNTNRALQGASPYLVNADLTYSPEFKNGQRMNLALLYNLQGPRIHAVGISGLGDVTQLPVHTLNFVASYQFNDRMSISFKANDILNRDIVFEQDVPTTGKTVEVERFKTGTNLEVGFSLKL